MLFYLKSITSYIFQAMFFKFLKSYLHTITKKKRYLNLRKILSKIIFFFLIFDIDFLEY